MPFMTMKDEGAQISEARELLLVARIEEHIAERESRRFRTLYTLIGLVSFIGIGVLTQLVDFYSSKSVDIKIKSASDQLMIAKSLSQLLSLSLKLDLSDSFSNTDRDTIMTLLLDQRDTQQLRREPAFLSLLEKILESFSASGNNLHVRQIFAEYRRECLLSPNTTIVLLQHFGREYLSAEDITDRITRNTYIDLTMLIDAARTHSAAGAADAFYVLSAHKRGVLGGNQIRSLLTSYQALQPSEIVNFFTVLDSLSDESRMAKVPSPEISRIAHLAQSFTQTYAPEIAELRQQYLVGDPMEAE